MDCLIFGFTVSSQPNRRQMISLAGFLSVLIRFFVFVFACQIYFYVFIGKVFGFVMSCLYLSFANISIRTFNFEYS